MSTLLAYLPVYLRRLPEPRVSQLRHMLSEVEKPLITVDADISKVFKTLTEPPTDLQASVAADPYLRILGAEQLGWSQRLLERVRPVLAWYLQRRGTKSGIERLLRTILPDTRFSFLERTFPVPTATIGEWIGGRVGPSEGEQSVVTLELYDPVSVELAQDLESFLKCELPTGICAYVVLAKIPGVPHE